ncbi:hypothetical protein BKA67DRAFT_665041 [Truncatella angustata]|uniref:Uncharacterized protein n=1 Tax=Truncatella angustata TaxID=152316 RepID=A0A9P8RL87_9PEZI|nr:uncharacterized protein BKA67DRAFT_665041 [Truncatella angustata]KAH6645206.1 hypothetical protein BKA67DRAFT_665041 [Truncatella angustata]
MSRSSKQVRLMHVLNNATVQVGDQVHQDLTKMRAESTDTDEYVSKYNEYTDKYHEVFKLELARLIDQHKQLKNKYKEDGDDESYLNSCKKIDRQVSLYYAIDNNYVDAVQIILEGWRAHDRNIINGNGQWGNADNMAWLILPVQYATEKRRPEIVKVFSRNTQM